MIDLPILIVCAANRIKLSNGHERIILGIRHWGPEMAQYADDLEIKSRIDYESVDQGFIDNRGNFHSREDAWMIAFKEGQIKRYVGCNGELYSENLY